MPLTPDLTHPKLWTRADQSTARNEKRLIWRPCQAILLSNGRPRGECRL